jgi:histone H3/H4
MRYILYRTTCTVNGKYYIGKHKTDDLADDYLGSGLALKRAIRKYGKENFSREILGEFATQDELDMAEKQMITEEILSDPNCYNLALGGQGGFLGNSITQKIRDSWTKERRNNASKAAKKRWKNNRSTYEKALKTRGGNWDRLSNEQKEQQKQLMSSTIRDLWKNPKHREKMKAVRVKTEISNNFVYANKGKKWMISKEGIRKLVKQEDIEELLKSGWTFGMTCKH